MIDRTKPMSDDDSEIVKLTKQALEDSERWFPDVAHSITHHTISIAGEVGEFANLVKKLHRGTTIAPTASEVQYELAMELTDIFIYLLNLAAILDVNLVAAYYHKRDLNVKRFEP